jgi:transcriptional regulator with XRE-family HTH domain
MKNYNLEEFGKRVRRIRDSLHMSQRKFAEGIDMSKSFISDIEKGSSKAGYKFFNNVSKVYNVNLIYLIHGEGEMFSQNEAEHSPGNKEIGEPIDNVRDMLWYMERSPLMLHTIIGFAAKLLHDNEAHIKKEISIYESKKEGKND